MNPSVLEHTMTLTQSEEFEDQGYIIIERVLPEDVLRDANAAIDRLYEEALRAGLAPSKHFFLADFLRHADVFVDLLDWPRIFPIVWRLLGWNIYCYHTHLGVTPPAPMDSQRWQPRLGWHQDGGRMNYEIETPLQPRVAVKVGYFLSDASECGRGNLLVLPRSHTIQDAGIPADPNMDPAGTVSVCVPAGSAVVFDRRLWHATESNMSTDLRKVLYYGYSYRWLRPKDEMTVAELLDGGCPVRRQLLGEMSCANDAFNPVEAETPLHLWLSEHAPEELSRCRCSR